MDSHMPEWHKNTHHPVPLAHLPSLDKVRCLAQLRLPRPAPVAYVDDIRRQKQRLDANDVVLEEGQERAPVLHERDAATFRIRLRTDIVNAARSSFPKLRVLQQPHTNPRF